VACVAVRDARLPVLPLAPRDHSRHRRAHLPAILTSCPRRRPAQFRKGRELDPGLLKRLPDRLRDLRGVGRIAVDADALDVQLELFALDRPHLAVADEAQRALAHLLWVTELLHALEDELARGVVVEVDVALAAER